MKRLWILAVGLFMCFCIACENEPVKTPEQINAESNNATSTPTAQENTADAGLPTSAPTSTPTPTSTLTPTPTVKLSICPYDITVLPVVTIDTKNEPVSEDKTYTDAIFGFYSPDASYEKEAVEAGIRLRGNGSRKLDKKSFKFKLEDKKNLYGLGKSKEKTWVLIANHSDGSLLRNYTAYKLQREFSCIDWEPNCTSVEVYLNGEYQGVYLLCEEIRVSKDCVNIDDSNTKRVDNAFLVQFSAYASYDKNRFIANAAAYEVMSELSSDENLAAKQVEYIKKYLEDCMNALETKSKEEAAKLMDLDSLVACYLTEEISKNVDAQWDSFYLYKDLNGKLVFGPVWDFDLAFGNDKRTLSSDEKSWEGVFAGNGKGSTNGSKVSTWFATAMRRDWFRQMVVEAWEKEYARFESLPTEIRRVASDGKEGFDNNFKKWNILGKSDVIETPVISDLKTHEAQVKYLADWIENRIKWLNDEFHRSEFISCGATGARTVVKHEKYGFVANQKTVDMLEAKKNLNEHVLIDSIQAVWGFGAEVPPCLFDNDLYNKYCTVSYDGNYPVIFDMDEPTEITNYVIYTGNDTSTFANRNPLYWTLYGSNDGEKWDVLHEVTDGRNALGAEDNTGYGFTVKKSGKYKTYAFVFVNDDTIQMAEIILLN